MSRFVARRATLAGDEGLRRRDNPLRVVAWPVPGLLEQHSILDKAVALCVSVGIAPGWFDGGKGREERMHRVCRTSSRGVGAAAGCGGAVSVERGVRGA